MNPFCLQSDNRQGVQQIQRRNDLSDCPRKVRFDHLTPVSLDLGDVGEKIVCSNSNCRDSNSIGKI